jgi:hypothetical protein
MFGLRLIPNARTEFHRLWSIRVAVFFFVLNGALVGLAALGDVLNPWLFMGLNVAGYAVLGVARLTKQAEPDPVVTPEPSDVAA